MRKHALWMILGCGIPILLLLVAPVLGLNNNITLILFIAAMFACHFMMIRHSRNESANHHDHLHS